MIELDKIYNEDCLEGMKRIPDGSVDAVICDLPYEVLNDGNPDAQWDKMIPLDKLWNQFKRVTKPNAAIVLFAQGMFTADLMQSNRKMWRYNLVWDKCRTTGFLNCNRMPLRSHEDICIFYRELPTYNPQMTKGMRNHPRGFHNDKNSCYGKYQLVPRPNKGSRFKDKYPQSIISFEKINATEVVHPTQKPVDLLRYLILTYSNEGDTILDATIGSGTTAVAALMEKRHFIGFETNKEYFDIAQGRIDQVLRNPTLF